MSLVNDALKRAKDAQQKSPRVAAGPELRPAELAPMAKISRGLGPTTPVIIVLIVCTGLILLLTVPWHRSTENHPTEIKVSARANPVSETRPPAQTAPVATSAAVVKPAVTKSAVVKPTVAAQAPVQPTPAPSVVPAPAPVSLKLQAIFFVPGRSSAIINGKTVRAGDTIQGFRVTAINQNSATLISYTATNVMKLEEQ